MRPDLTDQDLGTVRSDVKNRITSLDGTVDKEDDWGRRQLAFEIKDFTEGTYTILHFKLPPENPGRLRDQLKIDERIIRYMITKPEPKKPAVEPRKPAVEPKKPAAEPKARS